MSNELVQSVSKRVQDMQDNEGLRLPKNYSVGNALNAAWLILTDDSKGKSLLDKCDTRSVSKALLNMVIQGLSPAKNQCYFIPYGNQCTLLRSYFGSMSVIKRLKSVKDIYAEVVFQDDDFEIGSDRGRLIVKKYEPHFENRDKPIIGAFAVVEESDGGKVYTVMTKKEIDQSWSHAMTTKVQKEFPQEMAQRTVLSRAAKYYINSSDDNDLYVQAVNETTESEYDNKKETKDVTPKPEKISQIFDQPDSQDAVDQEPASAGTEVDQPVSQVSESQEVNQDVTTGAESQLPGSIAEQADAQEEFFNAEPEQK